MIEATPHLERLAAATLEAFAEARVSAVAAQEALKSERPRCSRQVLGVLDGVTYWSLFATFLAERYAQIGGIERVMTTHPLAHWWTIDDALTVQLKSDTGNLTVDQLVIPGMRHTRQALREFVVLTWDHVRAERFEPAFVQVDGKREVWRRPVAALLTAEVAAIRPTPPTAKVSSTRSDVVSSDEVVPPS
jgi:hypothetical protein